MRVYLAITDSAIVTMAKAMSLIKEDREVSALAHEPLAMSDSGWKRPSAGLVKINFDGGKLGSWGYGATV